MTESAGTSPEVEQVDVLVVGGGIVGAAAARALAQSGRSVVLIEKSERGHALGSSHGASRIFRQGYTQDDYIALTQRALALWRELEREAGAPLLEQTGAIDHGDPVAVRAIGDALERNGIGHEWLTPADAGARWPGFRFTTPVLFSPSSGRLNSAAALEAFCSGAEAAGADLRFGVEAGGIHPTDDGSAVLVDTTDGVIRARQAVLAVGSWAPALVGDLARAAGRALPDVVVTQEQPAHFRSIVPEESWPSFVEYLPNGHTIYGLVTPGEGVKVGEHGTGTVVDPDVRDFAAEPTALARLQAYVRDNLPGADHTAPAPISCLYDTTPTEDFVLDRIGPVTIATGFSGHGFKFAPVLGELITALVSGEPAHPRFALRPPG